MWLKYGGGKKPTWEEKVKNKHQTLKHEELLLHLQNAKDWKLSNILVKMVNVHACACMRAWVCVCVCPKGSRLNPTAPICSLELTSGDTGGPNADLSFADFYWYSCIHFSL